MAVIQFKSTSCVLDRQAVYCPKPHAVLSQLISGTVDPGLFIKDDNNLFNKRGWGGVKFGYKLIKPSYTLRSPNWPYQYFLEKGFVMFVVSRDKIHKHF